MEVFVDYLQELNWFAVFFAALVAFITGAIWYAEGLFGKRWKKEVGLTDNKIKQANMTKLFGVSFITIVITAIAIGILVQVLVLESAWQGALFGVMLAVGILGANKLMQVEFEQRSNTYWYIVLGADIVAFAAMGAILAVWQ